MILAADFYRRLFHIDIPRAYYVSFKKRSPPKWWRPLSALPILLGRPSIVMPSASVRGTLAGIKNLHISVEAFVRITYPPG